MPNRSNYRQRIADILHDNGCHPDDAKELADALVRELGMHGEMSRANPTAWFNKGPWVRRFVSRWELADA